MKKESKYLDFFNLVVGPRSEANRTYRNTTNKLFKMVQSFSREVYTHLGARIMIFAGYEHINKDGELELASIPMEINGELGGQSFLTGGWKQKLEQTGAMSVWDSYVPSL